MLAMPSNLLAHHLHVLQQAGVITRRRSEGDRRRTYLRLLPGALDPLAAPPARRGDRSGGDRSYSVVNLCGHGHPCLPRSNKSPGCPVWSLMHGMRRLSRSGVRT